jgi:DNA-binding NtrC family response regulator
VPLRRSASERPAAKDYGIVGTSAEVRRLRAAVEMAAQSSSSVLVTGEPGSGKELVARGIHEASGGSRARFVSVRCGELPNHLVESELFGHTRGAFPGASAEYLGLFRNANGGTLFLQEITELSPEIQAKLLRVLEHRAVVPVGATAEVPVDLRVVASTSRDPADAVASGQLRSDLYYRLQSFNVQVPALRERREDIPLLAEHFLATFCHRRCGCIWGLSQRALEVLMTAEWPGNVRELRSVIEHAVSHGDSGLIQVLDLPEYLRGALKLDESRSSEASSSDLPSLAEAEAQLIRATLEHFGGNKVRAAHSLGISRHKLYDRLRKLGIQ